MCIKNCRIDKLSKDSGFKGFIQNIDYSVNKDGILDFDQGFYGT